MNPSNTNQRPESRQICLNCQYFQNDPDHLEAVFPGLKVMSSGYASVRDQDGICNYNQLYLSAQDHCPAFTWRQP